jgi:hypothetical protein
MATDTQIASGISAYTPGPWRQEAGTNLVWGACDLDDTTSYGMGVPVAEAKVELNKTYDWDQALANARLIAAAPDLHVDGAFLAERLCDFAAVVDTPEAVREFCGHVLPALARFEAALAKVTVA